MGRTSSTVSPRWPPNCLNSTKMTPHLRMEVCQGRRESASRLLPKRRARKRTESELYSVGGSIWKKSVSFGDHKWRSTFGIPCRVPCRGGGVGSNSGAAVPSHTLPRTSRGHKKGRNPIHGKLHRARPKAIGVRGGNIKKKIRIFSFLIFLRKN